MLARSSCFRYRSNSERKEETKIMMKSKSEKGAAIPRRFAYTRESNRPT